MDTLLEITKTAVGQAVLAKFAETAGITEAAMLAIVMERGKIGAYYVEVVRTVIAGLAEEDAKAA